MSREKKLVLMSVGASLRFRAKTNKNKIAGGLVAAEESGVSFAGRVNGETRDPLPGAAVQSPLGTFYIP
jgi:hypothetical protein